MKGLLKSLAVFAFLLAAVSVVYYLYKTKCPHACRNEFEEDLEEVEEEVDKKKSAPHSRGYFNLNRIREAEAIIKE